MLLAGGACGNDARPSQPGDEEVDADSSPPPVDAAARGGSGGGGQGGTGAPSTGGGNGGAGGAPAGGAGGAGRLDAAPPDAGKPDAAARADAEPDGRRAEAGAEAGAGDARPGDGRPDAPTGEIRGVAKILPFAGNTVTGDAVIRVSGGKVRLTIDFTHAPLGDHGLHLHEVGDCGNNGQASGTDWNPTMMPHPKHLGDLGNPKPDANGSQTVTYTNDKWTIGTGAATDLLGKAIIYHAKRDDYQSQPDGDSGGIIACGVIVKP